MPSLKALLNDPAAMAALVEEMAVSEPVREEPRLNHGIRNFEELEAIVAQAPFDEDDERQMAQVYQAALVMTSPR